jgi:NurA-like 5'-3' nuclease
MDSDTIKLSETLYSTKKLIPDEVNITSPSFGTISQINPPLNIFKNQTVFFDVSDSSLAFRKNSANYTAFDLNFYSDAKFKNKLFSSSSTSSFEVKKFGDIGKSSAYVSLSVNDNIPNVLYYRLEPVNIQNNTSVKKEIIIDVPLALSIMFSGYLWPLFSWNEFTSGNFVSEE